MKQTQKAVSKKGSLQKQAWSSTPNRKTLVWLVAAAIVLLALIGWFVLKQLAIHNDRLRFEDASNVKTEIVDRLITYLGNNVASTREQDECFNTEQRPYDNGKLWCQVATVIRLKGDVDYASVGNNYLKVGEALNLQTSSDHGLFPSYTIITKDNIRCELEIVGLDGHNEGASRRIPFNNKDGAALAVTCADRAQVSYYSYVPRQ